MTRTLPFLASFLLFLDHVTAQSLSGKGKEVHPKLDIYTCTKRGGCKKQTSYIVLDSAMHPIYQKDNPSLGCGDWGSAPNKTVCPDAKTCNQNCVIDQISDYSAYGVKTKGSSLYLDMLRDDLSTISPRAYLMDSDQHKYDMIQLTGNEFTFDVDVSKLPCGMNGALYMSEMNKYGGKNSLNKGGAELGNGYCDAQCYTFPFVDGVGNIEGKGACCNELDIWEANRRSTALVPHPCNISSIYQCTGAECGFEGVCDKWGCGFNPYGVGNPDFYGEQPEADVDTKRPFTVVTSFPAENGVLKSITRKYIQDGKIISNAVVNLPNRVKKDYIDDAFCEENPGGTRRFTELGGMAEMGEAMSRGMVLAFAVWWDVGGFMDWLDGTASGAGPCNSTEGNPEFIKTIQPDVAVEFSEIKWGEIGSTYKTK
ncbi:concanavalin A-like lectin/glucanase domain-containing protein [Leptodontidium sp. MPI-SDFR-AT-0119]|nr:concanavalin A-like lectin/glucanase domain-containing protein [Leptodontidium sp. MPI-SDFR-AT-0119]